MTSPVPDPLFREVPKTVEPAEILQIVAGYGLVAGHCVVGGFDGAEVQARAGRRGWACACGRAWG